MALRVSVVDVVCLWLMLLLVFVFVVVLVVVLCDCLSRLSSLFDSVGCD